MVWERVLFLSDYVVVDVTLHVTLDISTRGARWAGSVHMMNKCFMYFCSVQQHAWRYSSDRHAKLVSVWPQQHASYPHRLTLPWTQDIIHSIPNDSFDSFSVARSQACVCVCPSFSIDFTIALSPSSEQKVAVAQTVPKFVLTKLRQLFHRLYLAGTARPAAGDRLQGLP